MTPIPLRLFVATACVTTALTLNAASEPTAPATANAVNDKDAKSASASKATSAAAPRPAVRFTPPKAERIAEIVPLLSAQPAGPGRPITDRAVWDALGAQPLAKEIIADAEKHATQPTPPIPLETWEAYRQKGDRVPSEKAFCARTYRLADLALAECFENKGRFLPALEETLAAILSGTWSVPAHDASEASFKGEKTMIELTSSQCVYTLATVDYWLGDKLRADTRAQIREHAKRRIFDTYRRVVSSGVVSDKMGWLVDAANWNTVCNAGVIGAAMTLIESPEERAFYVAAAEVFMPYYLKAFANDGVNDEGIGYWSYGYGHFVYLSETIRRATRDRIDLMSNPLSEQAAIAVTQIEMVNSLYPAFGDQGIDAKPGALLVAFGAKRYGKDVGGDIRFDRPNRGGRHPLGAQLYSTIYTMFGQDAPVVRRDYPAPVFHTDPAGLRDWLMNAGVFIFRPVGRNPQGLALGLKGGHNGEHHNHNDVGSFVVTQNGDLVLVDPGMETYTKESFGPRRYEVDINSSHGHSVPVVAGQLQLTGEKARGVVLESKASPEEDRFVLDMTSAYGVPALKKLTRTVIYRRVAQSAEIEILDEVVFDSPQTFGTALIARGSWKETGPNQLRFTNGKGAVNVTFTTEAGPLAFSGAPITGFNAKTVKATRVGIAFTQPVKQAVLRTLIVPGEPELTAPAPATAK